MNDVEFNKTLEKALSGDMESTYKLIKEYEGLIIKNSFINGLLDEDCKATIVEKLIKNIKKFKNFSQNGKN